MAITEVTSSSGLSVSTTELGLTNGTSVIASNTDDGVYQVFLDLNALAAGDIFEFKAYEKVHSAGTQRVIYSARFAGAQGQPVWASPSLVLVHGWDFSLKKISGTDRSILYSIRKVV